MDSLIDRLKNKDPEAISIVYDKYAPALNGIISGIIESHEVAEEILQQTFVRVLKEIPTYTGHLSLFSWMMNIARKTALESLAQNTGVQKTIKLKANISQEVLNCLDSDCREVIICLCLRGYSVAQTAEALRISVDEVKRNLRLGLTRIDTYLKSLAARKT